MGKSSHHKTENTFKFQSFSERIARVNIDVIHRIRYNEDQPEESGTYFGEALTRWTELNCTEHFSNFRSEISPQVQSFNQLVHHEPEIVSGLQRHLQVPNSLAIEPLLDLVVQLARDLQFDFYKHFGDFFTILVGLLNSNPQDSELLEKVFTNLSYLFKFLWRYLLKDIHNVYGTFSTLLGNNYKDYIQNFAAESFSFLMRKVKSPDDLLDFLFKSLDTNPEQTAGLGRLLFEMMKGVRNQFHSCLNQTFPMILSKLGPVQLEDKKDAALPWQLVEQAISNMMSAMADYSTSEYLAEPWNLLLSEVDRLCESVSKGGKSRRDLVGEQLARVLRLLHGWLIYHGGKIIINPGDIASRFHRLLKLKSLPEETIETLLNNIAQLLLLSHSKLSMENTAKLTSLVFKTSYDSSLLKQFTINLFELPLFEKDVLPSLLAYCDKQMGASEEGCQTRMISLLSQLVMFKCPIPNIIDGSLNTESYMLDFSSFKTSKKKMSVPQYLCQILSSSHMIENMDPGKLWSALVCLPQVRPVQKDSAVGEIKRLIKEGVSLLQSSPNQRDDTLGLLYQMVWTLTLIQDEGELYTLFPVSSIYKLCKIGCHNNITFLRLCDLYFAQAKEEGHTDILDSTAFETLHSKLRENLSSSSREIRLLTVRIFTQFDLPVPIVEERSSAPLNVFEICYQAEKVPVGVCEYKEKLMYLRRLDWDIVQNSVPSQEYIQVPLRFLIGSLYNNFKLLWEPICELIGSHGNNLDRQELWEVYLEELRKASVQAEKVNDRRSALEAMEDESDPSELKIQFDHYKDTLSHESTRPDFTNFRCLLWKAMEHFPMRVEAKSRDIVTIVMNFLQNEYYSVDVSAAPTQDITLKQGEVIETGDENESQETKKPGGGKKRAIKFLTVILGVFSKFVNPRNIYKESQLSELYHQLFMHQSEELQKTAFSCILTYKFKYLMPYKENFERLLDEETFRDELVLFSLDEASSPIKSEHREQLLPLLFRLLYGRMKSKAGNNSSGKGNTNFRSAVIFRFLAGCKQDELKLFLDMVFEPSKNLLSDNPLKKIKQIEETLDLTKVIPLKKIQGIVNTINVLCKKLGHLLENYLPCLLQILLSFTQLCASCLAKRETIRPGSIQVLKNLRQLLIGQIIQFFREFEDYNYTADEVNAIFHVAVWPQLEKLPLEGVYHPTPLLKLFKLWSNIPRYICLLGKTSDNVDAKPPLHYVFKLLLAPSINPTVTSAIIEIADNLLSIPNFAPTIHSTVIPLQPFKERYHIQDQADDSSELSVGSQLLEPHIPDLLVHIEGAIKKLANEQTKKSTQITELRILSRVSSFVTDEEQCLSLIKLLLPFLGKLSTNSQEMELDILRSILNLIKSVSDVTQFYRTMCKLFSVIETRQSRQVLCDIFQVFGEKHPAYSTATGLVSQLNSWDRRRMEEPDYTVRLGAFQTINTTVKEMTEMDIEFLLPIIYNSCFFIVMVDDLSLRDNATHCMVTMVKQMTEELTSTLVFNDLIIGALLSQVKAGVKHKKEVVRHEFVTILAVLVNNFPNHPSFCELTGLTDKDLEADFFENIKHIQTHRRARALRRLIKYLQSHSMRLEFINCYLLPLTSSFLLDEAYLKYNSLQDAAVEAMGSLCRCLPWRYYYTQLKSYLGLLPKKINIQKLLIRIIVAVLDAFHFDLSASSFEISKAPKAVNFEISKAPKAVNFEISKAPKAVNFEISKAPKAVNFEKTTNEDSVNTVDKGEIEEVSSESLLENPDVEPDRLEEDVTLDLPDKIQSTTEQATKIHKLILNVILPQLHKSLTRKVRSEGEHKLARSNYAEDDEVLRVPLALAMIKLLQNLPQGSLNQTLPSVLMKVCHFLKSRSKDVREVARDTLVKMATSLGTHYFSYILTEMRSTLKRGYQLHVLTYTTHTILRTLTEAGQVTNGDLDECLPSLIEVFNEEVFGQVAEEKDVQGIVIKLMEAKSSKSYDSYELVSALIGQQALGTLIRPLKEILDNTKSQKTSKKAQDVLKRVCKGLIDNKGLTEEILLIFIHGLTSETLPALFGNNQKEKEPEKEVIKPGQKPPSCLLLTKAAPRGGLKPKPSQKTNAHIIVEFGLQLLHLLLKKSRLLPTNGKHLQMCAPFISVLADCLTSKHIKMTSVALRCLCWLLKFPIPSLKSHIRRIADAMFVLLKNYASAGAAKGDNKELVTMCFKAVTILVRDVKVFSIGTDQLKVLVSFCEEDVHDYDRQGTAFTLLKAILSRKLVLPEIHDLMLKVEKMALTAESPHVRLQSRQLTLQYLMDYPLGTKLQKHLEFFVTQLSYELESGRESALEMFATMFSSFPQHILIKYSGLFFFPMATSLVNDDSAKCKKLTALALKSLLGKIDLATRNDLFRMTLKWFSDQKLAHRVLGAQLVGLFVEVESAKFDQRLEATLPVICKQIDPEQYKEVVEDSVQENLDRLLFNSLTTLTKIFRECDLIKTDQWSVQLNQIWAHVESHLVYPHIWVQFASSQLFGLLFSIWTPSDLVSMATQCQSTNEYLLSDLIPRLCSLATNFCAQLQSPLLEQDLAEQVIKNMIFITKTANLLTSSEVKTVKISDKGDNQPSLSVRWLVKKMIREANHETIHQPKITIKRKNVFKWVGAVSIDLGEDQLPDYLPIMLPPLIRESSEKTNSTDSSLKTLALEVLELIKGTVGVEEFTRLYSTVHQVLQERRTNRKRQRAEEAVSNPEITARRKMKRNLNKKEAKKRRVQEFRPSQKIKKRKL